MTLTFAYFFASFAALSPHDPVTSGELGRGAALEEENGVIIGNGQKGTQICLSFLDNGSEFLPTVAHLHDTHPGAMPVEELRLGFKKNIFRQDGGAGSEVEDAVGDGGGGSGAILELGGGAGDGNGLMRRCREEEVTTVVAVGLVVMVVAQWDFEKEMGVGGGRHGCVGVRRETRGRRGRERGRERGGLKELSTVNIRGEGVWDWGHLG
ncbi:hypothetical protein Cgig2_001595 [Carnegiea gigantea]|uniref:Uncharacterized protein n=1 Tax=Carnegiea gigantea TaxID=171969 RepID=A0A9Q1KC66_9CARY|nr:hypothetical protein Cgig2_001595 [Carnegiea gigantea]